VRAVRVRGFGAVVAAVLIGGACSESAGGREAVDPVATLPRRSAAITSTTREPTTTTRPPRLPATIAFGGDVQYEGVLRSKLATDPDHDGTLRPLPGTDATDALAGWVSLLDCTGSAH